jgi:hypothetical protein
MKKCILILLVGLTLSIAFAGCKKSKDNDTDDKIEDEDKSDNDNIGTPAPSAGATPTAAPSGENVTEDGHEGEMISCLTGFWVPEEVGTRRPLAIQFSNFETVSDQWGISQADIVYEALVEGGITRLLGIGENYSWDRLGSIRSARHYFASFADEYDAIFIHYGKTKYAKSKLKELGLDNLDGETAIGNTVFYRDKSMKAPHNAFTSIDRIQKGIEKKKYRTQYQEDYKPHFSFYKEDTDIAGNTAARTVTIRFSSQYKPYFEFNPQDKLYYRFQFKNTHKDANTGKQLAFKNIIVQFVKEWNIDKNGYQTMDLEDASGKGYYITNGKVVEITWKKNEKNRWMRYYDAAGNELAINPGKTYIAVFPDKRTKDVVIE